MRYANAALCVLWLVSACAPSYRSEFETGGSIASVTHPRAGVYRTIAYLGERAAPRGFTRGPVPERVRLVIEQTFGPAFAERGYQTELPENADLLLTAGAGSRTVPCVGAECADDLSEPLEQGALVFDAFERESGLHVWHGHIQGAAVPDADVDLDRLRTGLRELLRQFPRAQTSE